MTHDLFHLVERGFDVDPDATAVVTQHGQQVSYTRLRQTILAFAFRLLDAQVRAGHHVAVDLQNPAARLALILAISRIGGVYVAGAPPTVMISSGVSLDAVVTDRLRPPGDVREILFEQSWSADNTPGVVTHLPGLRRETDTALILGSSGTTGKPKFMAFSPALVAQRLDDKDHLHGKARMKRLVTILPVAALGVELALQSLRCGGCVAWPVHSAGETLKLVADHRFEEIFTTPALIGELAHAQANASHDLARLSRIYVAGSGISPARAKLARDALKSRLYHLFGASETGSCTIVELTDEGPSQGVVGKPMPWLKVNIVDPSGISVPVGETGRVAIAAGDARRVKAYIGNDEDDHLEGDWFFTGDLGLINESGELVICGRASELINTGGNKIAPETIEGLAEAASGVTAAGAVGMPNADGFDDIGLAVVAEEGFVRADLIKRIQHGLAGSPKVRVRQVPGLPSNTAGKLDRNRLYMLISGDGD